MIQPVISETGATSVSVLPEFSLPYHLFPLYPFPLSLPLCPHTGGTLRLPNPPFHVPALETFSDSKVDINLQHWHNSRVSGFAHMSILGFSAQHM